MASRERVGPLLPVWPTAPVRERGEQVGNVVRRPPKPVKKPRRRPAKDHEGGIDTYAHGRVDDRPATMGVFAAR